MIILPMRNVSHIWSATGGKCEWAFVLDSLPDGDEYEFIQKTLELALRVIKRAMIADENRFTGFDKIPG